jgi:hypothetical protein
VLAPSSQLPSTLPVTTLLYCLFIFLENDNLPQRLHKMSVRGRNYLGVRLTRWIMNYLKICESLKKLIRLASYIVFKIFLLCWCLELTLKLLSLIILEHDEFSFILCVCWNALVAKLSDINFLITVQKLLLFCYNCMSLL